MSFRHLIGDSFLDYFHFDSKFFRTILPLLFKPGWLTLEYMKGRRKSYVEPFKLFLVISVELMGFVTEVAKRIAGRPRPATAMTDAVSSSFPSGHALGVMVGVLALLTVAWPFTGQRLRMPLVVLGAALAFTVGFSRVVLNVHHPSDVLAGWALGFLYYLLCVRLVPPRPLTAVAEKPAALDSVR